jgi:ubiquinone/menaquinone biosynthesis C-methylase UbiE
VLDFQDESFDIVVFTLSLHHVPDLEMITAINEAIRVVKREWLHIVFLEPATDGTFFDAEIMFDACDGDERKEKELAHSAIMSHPHLEHIQRT